MVTIKKKIAMTHARDGAPALWADQPKTADNVNTHKPMLLMMRLKCSNRPLKHLLV